MNGLYRRQRITGVQRYAHELVPRMQARGSVRTVDPSRAIQGSRGMVHLWEQTLLPAATRHEVLWSPTNTGPLLHQRHVVTVHDAAVLSHPEWFSPGYAAWRRWFLPQLLRAAAHVVTISEFSKQHILTHVHMPEKRVSVIPNGIDREFFRPMDRDAQDAVRTRFGLPTRYVLALGSLSARKNLDGLVEAWSRVAPELPEHGLVVVGAREATLRGIPRLDAAPRVTWTGYVPNAVLPTLYSAAESFAFPSRFEDSASPCWKQWHVGRLCYRRTSQPFRTLQATPRCWSIRRTSTRSPRAFSHWLAIRCCATGSALPAEGASKRSIGTRALRALWRSFEGSSNEGCNRARLVGDTGRCRACAGRPTRAFPRCRCARHRVDLLAEVGDLAVDR